MDELKKALSYLYSEFGLNEVTLALSEYVDKIIAIEQRDRLIKINENIRGIENV